MYAGRGWTEEMTVAETTKLAYPEPDTFLGEALQENEAQLAEQLADAIERGVRAQYQKGDARRDVHAKATGCVRAVFRVNDTIPASLAKGVFVPGKSYQAWIRFSNGSATSTMAAQDKSAPAVNLSGTENAAIPNRTSMAIAPRPHRAKIIPTTRAIQRSPSERRSGLIAQ
jgi:hypothetical protein